MSYLLIYHNSRHFVVFLTLSVKCPMIAPHVLPIASPILLLAYMHGKGYVHSDVKPQNILLSKKPKDPSDLLSVDFKLGDLGSAVSAGNPVIQVTVEYYPREIFTDVARPSMYSSLWALFSIGRWREKGPTYKRWRRH